MMIKNLNVSRSPSVRLSPATFLPEEGLYSIPSRRFATYQGRLSDVDKIVPKR